MRPEQKLLLASGLFLLAFLFLYQVRTILDPFVWGAVVAYVLHQPVQWLGARLRLPRWAVVAPLYLLLLFSLFLLARGLAPALGRELQELAGQYPHLVQGLAGGLTQDPLLSQLGLHVEPGDVEAAVNLVLADLGRQSVRLAAETIEVVGKLLAFLFVSFLLLLDGPHVLRRASEWIPQPARHEMTLLAREINGVLRAYMRGQLVLFLLMSLGTYIVIGPILHLRFAVAISLLTGALELIPVAGPITAGAVACAVAFLQPNDFGLPGWAFALIVAGVYTALRHLEDYLVIPNVIGRIVKLHPVAVLFALLSGLVIGGILGMFLAVPTAASLRIVARYLRQRVSPDAPASIQPVQ